MIALKFLRTWFFLLPLAGQDYTYDNPSKWIFRYPDCAGSRQSPISLYFLKSITGKLAPISFHYYDVPLAQPVHAKNNGHTIEVSIESTIDGNRPSITGGGLDDVYEVQAFHFHWGSPLSRGSEHAIAGKKYDLEMHIVHKNVKHKTVEDATSDPFGLAVLGVLFKGVKSKPVNATGLNEVFDVLPYLSKFQAKRSLNGSITMQSILGDLNTQQFFTYRGSLTTPPCSEAVTWFVFPDIIPIETKNLKRFWNIYDQRGVHLLNNYRPIQLTRKRKVYYRKSNQ